MRKLLILLGAARYPSSPDLALAAFAPSHAAFLAAMTGGEAPIVSPDDVLDLFDTDALWTQQQLQMNAWLKERAPAPAEPRALLIYYLGHGGLADDGSQFFMAINSTNDFDPLGSSISRDSFSLTLNKAARLFRKYLIIDCCFAANVIAGMQGAVDDKMSVELKEVDKQLLKDDSSGLAAICSSDSISTSNALGRNGLTQFTDALIETLRLGDPNGGAELTFEALRNLIEPQLKQLYGEKAVPPSSRFDDNVRGPIHRIGLFPNRAERRRPAGPFAARTQRWQPRGRGKKDIASQLALGNPSSAVDSPDNFLIRRPQYAAAFDGAAGRPKWVSWHLRAEDLGEAPRTNRWTDDPLIPAGTTEGRMSMFVRSGFDRGCLCPSGNRSATIEDRNAVTLLTNVIAQEARRNRDLWAGFEKFCLDLVRANQIDLYIVAGPLGSRERIAGAIDVPATVWKMVLIVPEGEVPGPRLKTAEVVAIRMANSAEASIADWTETLVTVSSLEDDTGLKLLGTLSPDLRDKLRRRRASYMADLIDEVTQGRPPLGIGAVRTEPPPPPTVSRKDDERFEAIRGATRELARAFVAHPRTGVPPALLQRLAGPIAAAGKPLTNLAIVDELLDIQGDGRHAAIFAAAVIIYIRTEYDYFDRLVAIAAEGKSLRGAPMWRVLRAIKRLCPGVEITQGRRKALVGALANLALNYDTVTQARFQTRDIVLLVAQTATLKRLKIDLERDGIFSGQQLADWAQFKAGDPVLVARPSSSEKR